MFERCFFINLDGSVERRERFFANVAAVDWPFPRPERFAGIEETPPSQYRAGRGGWGCLRSHTEIYHRCILEGVRSVVVFEDDAFFPDDFGERVRTFMAAVPEDWQQVYFCASHTAMPRVVNSQVLQCTQVNMGTAYALQGGGLSKAHAFLASVPDVMADPNLHIDVLFATLHKGEQIRAYAPWRSIVGHAPGLSDRLAVDGKVGRWNDIEWFNLPDEALHILEECEC